MGRRTEPGPVDLPALVGWHRTGLLLGITGVVVALAGSVVGVADGVPGPGRAAVLLLGIGTLLVLLAAVHLRRVWSEPLHRDGPHSRRGRLGTALVGLTWSVAVALNTLRAFGVPVPEPVRGLATSAFIGAVSGMLVLAVRDRPGRW